MQANGARSLLFLTYIPCMEGSNQTRWPPSSTYAIEKSMHAAVELNGAELFGFFQLHTVLTQLSTNFLKDNVS